MHKSPYLRWIALAAVLLTAAGRSVPAAAAPAKPARLAVLGAVSGGPAVAAAAAGARLAAKSFAGVAPFEGGVEVEIFDTLGTATGLAAALKAIKKSKPLGILALPGGDDAEAYWKAARKLRVPWMVLTALGPDAERNPGNVLLLSPSPVAEGVRAADAMLAPLAARRVGVLHAPTEVGRTRAAAFARNLSDRVSLAGVRVFDEGDDPKAVLATLKGMEADWFYVALEGGRAARFVAALAAADWTPACLFCDGNRNESLLEVAGQALDACVFLDGPDPELAGRLGEDLVVGLESGGGLIDVAALRGFEGARRVLAASRGAGSTKFKKVWAALAPEDEDVGAFGPLTFELHGGVRFFPFTYWNVRRGAFEMWPRGLLPTPGLGPPIGFGRPGPSGVNERKGKIGYLTYGEGDKRTIEQDLLEVGLSTNGKEPQLDELVRDEILGRAIRVAHRLFRRETDGTPIAGYSWGMSFRTTPPDKDTPRNKTWLAIVAGDHEAAGGQVIGSGMVAVYSTFLKRTMYLAHKLEPPLSAADRHLLDGSYRWGIDRANNRRADEIRGLIDGFSSAVGLTLAHEFGHLCGCGHDTEHPTSIMNVVAGAGASWEDAVWIESHERNVTTTLGIEGHR